MGEHDVPDNADDRQLRAFMRALLEDVQALERMLEEGRFETGVRRIGAEQEVFLVDRKTLRAAPVGPKVIEDLRDGQITTELASFNLEINASPRTLGGTCLSDLEHELRTLVDRVDEAARPRGARAVLTGILPTLTRADLTLDNMAPVPRYRALNRAVMQMRGGDIHVRIKGLDEIEIHHDNVMLEACNTSFQVHFQVDPDEFARLYNVAQAVTAPVLAAAVNSPLLLGQRLWHETRVALFQQAVDARSATHTARGGRPRVHFGDAWVRESVLEIVREDITRFRVVLAADRDEDPMARLDAGEIPSLRALRLHNGTIYRWNRACYGVGATGAHLRIENRVLPAGPTITDEVANAALFFGLMSAMLETYGDVSKVMPFDDAKGNFFAAARHGLQAQFRWIGEESISADRLLLDRLLPMAREGLASSGVDRGDAEGYLDVVRRRVERRRTGAQWMLDSLARMGKKGTAETRLGRLVRGMIEARSEKGPVHTWEPVDFDEGEAWTAMGYRTVGQIMSTDLFTVRPQDLVDLAASVMDWEHVRHVPVEDDQGHLIGILTHRSLLRLVARGGMGSEPVAVRDLMTPEPVTVTPDTPTVEAMRLMRDKRISCLPVVEDTKLVGIVTERDLIDVSARLLESHLETLAEPTEHED
ncbi:MAG: CBS domain-containing protein [Deltaproteobacteria bacterium]|nr:MAG: CBS domain-containing protein [Deltaproteobacteria bacterium]